MCRARRVAHRFVVNYLGAKARAGGTPKYDKNALSLAPFSHPYRVIFSEAY
jgi:hypothetical protein